MDKNCLVNRCVRESFGKRFFGDWDVFKRVVYENYGYVRGDSPQMIAEHHFWLADPKLAGYFEGRNPTKVRIKREYLPKAEKNKELYERESGEKVEIKLMDDETRRVFQ